MHQDDSFELEQAARRKLRRLHAEALRGPRPGVEGRVLAGFGYEARHQPRSSRLAAAAAALLATGIIVGLLASRFLAVPATRPAAFEPVAIPPPGPTPVAAPAPCRLPLDRGTQAAFVEVLSFTSEDSRPAIMVDPAGHPRLPDGEDPQEVTYSWAADAWLPVPNAWVAADGLHYAWSDRTGALHVTAAGSGGDHVVNRDGAWTVVAYRQEGIYAARSTGAPGMTTGLWLVDPTFGRARQLASSGLWVSVSSGAAWALTNARALRTSLPVTIVGDTLVRLDLRTGRRTTIWVHNGPPVFVVGVDPQGNAYLNERPSPTGIGQMLEVVGPGRALYLGSDSLTTLVADGDRVWIGGGYSTAIYVKDASGIRPVLGGLGGGAVRVAGPCR